MKCTEIALARRPAGILAVDDLEVREVEVSSHLEAGEVLVQLLWLSVDPYLRTRMNEPRHGLYMPPFELSKAIETLAVAKVIDSSDPDFQAGELVLGLLPVCSYTKFVQRTVFPYTKVEEVPGMPLFCHLGALGMTSFTAWIGIALIGEAKPGEEVFISAASGAVGIAAGRFAKERGCRVVGSAGTDEKVRLLKEEFGFDDAFNYKAESDWDAVLGRMFPNGIDVYFENVGGRMLEAVLNHINKYGRIPICGMISQYNKDPEDREGVHNLMTMIGKEVLAKGFLVGTYWNRLPDFLSEATSLVAQGKFKFQETVTEGIENFGTALIGLLKGENIGKSLVHVADP